VGPHVTLTPSISPQSPPTPSTSQPGAPPSLLSSPQHRRRAAYPATMARGGSGAGARRFRSRRPWRSWRRSSHPASSSHRRASASAGMRSATGREMRSASASAGTPGGDLAVCSPARGAEQACTAGSSPTAWCAGATRHLAPRLPHADLEGSDGNSGRAPPCSSSSGGRCGGPDGGARAQPRARRCGGEAADPRCPRRHGSDGELEAGVADGKLEAGMSRAPSGWPSGRMRTTCARLSLLAGAAAPLPPRRRPTVRRVGEAEPAVLRLLCFALVLRWLGRRAWECGPAGMLLLRHPPRYGVN
jgi:hypothetical protein